MGLKRRKATEVVASEGSNLDWGNLDNGEYEARLIYVIDLGMQRKEYDKEFKGNYQSIMLGFEVLGKGITNDDGKALQRILWSKQITIYDIGFTKKGGELEMYKSFVPSVDATDEADWSAQLYKPVMLTVKQEKGKNKNKDKTFDKITNIASVPERYQADIPDALTEGGINDAYDLEDPITKGLYGLAKAIWEKRLPSGEEEEEVFEPKEVVPDFIESVVGEEEDGIEDDDIPF